MSAPIRRFRRFRGGEHGSASSFAVIVVAVLMLVAGLCIEGGRVLNARATMADQAEQARAPAPRSSPSRACAAATPSH